MNRWLTQAVVFGVALSEASAGNPLHLSPGHLSLSESGAHTDGNDGFNEAYIYFEYLNQCAQANLDKDTCLVAKTVDAIIAMDGPPTGDDGEGSYFPTPSPSHWMSEGSMRHRFLQDNDCGAPNISEEELRHLVNGSKEQCVESGLSVTDQEFESVVSGFMTVFSSDICFQQMCEDEPSGLFYEIMFDEAAKCAGVEQDINPCLKDRIIEMMAGGGDGGDSATPEDKIRRKLVHAPSLTHSMDGGSSCERPSEAEVEWFVSFMLFDAQSQCADLGAPVSQEEVEIATSDITSIISAWHCWPDDGCEEEPSYDDDWYGDGHWHENDSEMSLYIGEVCGLIGDLNADVARRCLQPVCDLGVEGAWKDAFTDDSTHGKEDNGWSDDYIVPNDDYGFSMPTDDWLGHNDDELTPSPSPTVTAFTSVSTPFPTSTPSLSPTPKPTPKPTAKPTPFPTRKPTQQPSLSPIQVTFGSVEGTFCGGYCRLLLFTN